MYVCVRVCVCLCACVGVSVLLKQFVYMLTHTHSRTHTHVQCCNLVHTHLLYPFPGLNKVPDCDGTAGSCRDIDYLNSTGTLPKVQ